MSLPLRITFHGKDYTYTVLTKKIENHTTEIKIEFNGEEMTVARNISGEWDIMERTIVDEPELLKAIARSLALRYRLR